MALHSSCQGGACRGTKPKVLKCSHDVRSSDSPNSVTGGNVVRYHGLATVVEDSPALRAAMGVVFLGGVGRLMAWRRSDCPHPVFLAALALELVGMPVAFAWQRHVAALAK